MAPIEMEYGRVININGEDTFLHGDWNGAESVQPGKKESVEDWISWYDHHLKVKIEGECASEDNGGFIKYELRQFKWFRKGTLEKGTLIISEGQTLSRIIKHPKEKSLVGGFRIKHVKPTPEDTNSQ